jgi:hypothetical protein
MHFPSTSTMSMTLPPVGAAAFLAGSGFFFLATNVLDIDGVRAVQRHSVDLVVFRDRLAGDGIDLTALDAIARRAVEPVKANYAVFRRRRHQMTPHR